MTASTPGMDAELARIERTQRDWEYRIALYGNPWPTKYSAFWSKRVAQGFAFGVMFGRLKP